MGRQGIDADGAFDLVRRALQRENDKLRDRPARHRPGSSGPHYGLTRETTGSTSKATATGGRDGPYAAPRLRIESLRASSTATAEPLALCSTRAATRSPATTRARIDPAGQSGPCRRATARRSVRCRRREATGTVLAGGPPA